MFAESATATEPLCRSRTLYSTLQRGTKTFSSAMNLAQRRWSASLLESITSSCSLVRTVHQARGRPWICTATSCAAFARITKGTFRARLSKSRSDSGRRENCGTLRTRCPSGASPESELCSVTTCIWRTNFALRSERRRRAISCARTTTRRTTLFSSKLRAECTRVRTAASSCAPTSTECTDTVTKCWRSQTRSSVGVGWC
mmetsp:Transcript_7851/g.20768  ORF Transcript_7851/g.20768 Transcript_7851/m.20768 type:complete len:201 (-) Transcript_7851:472-1074(-)